MTDWSEAAGALDRAAATGLAAGDEAAAAAPEPRLEDVMAALAEVIDPEIGLDLVTLGLIYDVGIDRGRVCVTHSLTTPGCPLEAYITESIRVAVAAVPHVAEVETRLVWEPAWTPDRIRGE